MSGTEYLNNYNANRPTILEAQKHYRVKLTTLVKDEEIESGKVHKNLNDIDPLKPL
jgi:hypothetical protein